MTIAAEMKIDLLEARVRLAEAERDKALRAVARLESELRDVTAERNAKERVLQARYG